jgi:hypothetical protein
MKKVLIRECKSIGLKLFKTMSTIQLRMAYNLVREDERKEQRRRGKKF